MNSNPVMGQMGTFHLHHIFHAKWAVSGEKKIALYLSVNEFSRKVLFGDTIFTPPCGDGTAIFRGHPSQAKVSPFAGQRKYLHFSVILRPRVLLRHRDVEPTTSRSAVKRSTD